MFLRWLNSFSSSFHPRGQPALCWANSRSSAAFSSSNLQQFIPASHPRWPVQGFPPWPPPLLHPHPSARLFFTGRTFQPFDFSSGNWCSLHSSAGRMMERPDREPPNKRWKNREEKGEHIGRAPRETRDRTEEGESKRDYNLRSNHHFRVGNHDKTKSRGERSASRDTSREKNVERTKSEKKGSRDGTPNQHSHPEGSRTQTPKSKPVTDQVPEHKPNPWFKRRPTEEQGHKPNPWFKGRPAEEQGHNPNPWFKGRPAEEQGHKPNSWFKGRPAEEQGHKPNPWFKGRPAEEQGHKPNPWFKGRPAEEQGHKPNPWFKGRPAEEQGHKPNPWFKGRPAEEQGHKPNPWFKGRPAEEQGHKPNPWFKGRPAEELGGPQRSKTGPLEQLKDGGGDAAKWTELRSKPSSTSQTSNTLQADRTHRPPPPPGIHLPVKPLQRYWETCSTEPQPPGDSAVFDFSVMSYNILSQELLQDNAYLYQHCEPSVLPWEYRLPNLLAEIQQLNADILCLQEVQEDHYENQIKPALQAQGYQCEYKKRTGKKPDGCAVIFKTSRFSLLSSTPIEFFRPGDGLLDRDNVGLVLLLKPNNSISQSDSSSFICVANTHLLYNPRRGDVKLAQLAILLAEIVRLSRLPDGSTSPVVFCGDLNSTPWSPLYKFLTTGCLEYEGMQISTVSGQETSPRGHRLLMSPIWSPSLGISPRCQYESKGPESSPTSPTGGISNLTVEDLTNKASAAVSSCRIEHSLKLQSSHQRHLMPDGRPEITTCHSRTALTVDYILHSADFATQPSLPGGRGLQLLGRLTLVGQSELEEVNNLPNQHHSSDHLPLLASFRLRC